MDHYTMTTTMGGSYTAPPGGGWIQPQPNGCPGCGRCLVCGRDGASAVPQWHWGTITVDGTAIADAVTGANAEHTKV